jgi:DNA-binding transcriptional LysR family regulator
MDLRALEAYVATADHGSLRAAAEALGTPRAEVEGRLRDLEGRLGLALLEPVGQDAVLAEAGEELLPRVLAVVSAGDRLLTAARELAVGSAGVLRLAASPGTAAVVRDLLSALRDRRPDVEVRLERPGTRTEVEAVRRGELDAALVRERPEGAGLEAVEVARAAWVAVLARDHPLAAGDGPLALRALAAHPFVAVRRGRPVALHAELDEALGGRLARGPVVPSVLDALDLVAASDGWTLLTEPTAPGDGEGTVVRPLDSDAQLTPVRVWLVVRPGEPAPALAELLAAARGGASA